MNENYLIVGGVMRAHTKGSDEIIEYHNAHSEFAKIDFSKHIDIDCIPQYWKYFVTPAYKPGVVRYALNLRYPQACAGNTLAPTSNESQAIGEKFYGKSFQLDALSLDTRRALRIAIQKKNID